MIGSKEITIIVHGLRNNSSGALAKFVIAKRRLTKLGYKYPVIGYSYDSNTSGAQYISYALQALYTGITIANKNGRNLAKFVIGHSLGAHVIQSTVKNLAKNAKNNGIIKAIYLFGGSIPADSFSPSNGSSMQKIISTKIRNYYSPHDDVLRLAHEWNWVIAPIGYKGAYGKTITKYVQTMVKPKNHRFVSYAKVLNSFP